MVHIFNNKDIPYLINEQGEIYSKLSNKFLKISVDSYGYPIVTLEKPVKKQYKVARLVLRTFEDNPNHHFLNIKYRDSNRKNICLSNLYWEDVNVPILEGENWKKILIEGKESFYSISNYGRCRNDSKGTILKGKFNKYTGYVSYCLNYRLKEKYISAHRAVMKAFCPIENMDLYVVNHIDGDKTNNKLSNLEWCTQQANVEHALQTNLTPTLYRNKQVYLYDLDGKFVDADTVNELSKKYELPYQSIINCIKGITKSVNKKYQVFEQNKGLKTEPWYKNTTAKEVFLYTISGEFIEHFNSQKDCANFLNIIPSTVSRCLKLQIPLMDKYILTRVPLL